MKRAEEWKFAKIAMPAVGMGIAGFPVRNGAEILCIRSVISFESHEYPEEVHIVLFDDETYQTFMESAKHLG